MICFSFLSAVARALFALWALLLCLTNIGNAVLAAVKKRFRFTFIAAVLFLPAYFLWQVIFDYSLFARSDKLTAATSSLCSLPWAYWLGVFVVLTLGTAMLLWYNIRYDKTFITPGTIKLYLDKMPCGICCWRESGRVLFSNICMNELCVAITDNSLLNGNHFKSALKGDIISVNGKVWRFSFRETELDGERLYEMIASNISTQYAKTQALEKDKAELSRLNNELREYYLSIDDSVKRREILQAKMNIHDEMNRLMLSSVAADKNDTGALDNIFTLWEQNALLLCMQADKKTVGEQSADVESLAEALGISVIWRQLLPDELGDSQKELFFFTAKEALINAAKHAGAKELEICVEENADNICCKFINGGKIALGEVRFEGGLANIALLAEKQGAHFSAEAGEKFVLSLTFK